MKAFVPHLSAALSLALLVVVILDVFNPMLGLLYVCKIGLLHLHYRY